MTAASSDTWASLLGSTGLRGTLDRAIPRYLRGCRWFGDRGRAVTAARIIESLPLGPTAAVHLVQVTHGDGARRTWVVPLALVRGPEVTAIEARRPGAVVMSVHVGGQRRLIVDATADVVACRELLAVIERGRRVRGVAGVATISRPVAWRALRGRGPLLPRLSSAEQSNTSVVYGDRLILKVCRRLTPGQNPELEMGRALAARGYAHSPPLAASIDYRADRAPAMTLALVQGFVANRGDAWRTALDHLERFFARAPRRGARDPSVELAGPWLKAAALLGRRTAELHLALATKTSDPAFAPVRASAAFQRVAHQSMVELTRRTLRQLRRVLPGLSPGTRTLARGALAGQHELQRRFDAFLNRRLTVVLTRCHGDLHLGQVLDAGGDFLITDFEGEPSRPLRERRQKHSPLRDVAGMLRSLHYAALTALGGQRARERLRPWAEGWHEWSTRAFLRQYLSTAAGAAFLPRAHTELRVLLDTFLLEKAVYELGYELNNRPQWLHIPLEGVAQLLGRGNAGPWILEA